MVKVGWISFGAVVLLSMPFVALLMVYLVATINWHDVLLVVCVIVMQFQLRLARREDWKIERALRRVDARRMLNETLQRDAA